MRRGVLGLAAAGVVLLAPAAHAAGRCGDHPWCDTALSADARAGLLLGALTSDWKVTAGCYRVLAGSNSRALPLSRRIGMGGRACH